MLYHHPGQWYVDYGRLWISPGIDCGNDRAYLGQLCIFNGDQRVAVSSLGTGRQAF